LWLFAFNRINGSGRRALPYLSQDGFVWYVWVCTSSSNHPEHGNGGVAWLSANGKLVDVLAADGYPFNKNVGDMK
jgi:hypothetical protein